jgi:hypothetical protein
MELQKIKRFFRSALDKISREYGKSTSQFGIKPEPKRVKGKLQEKWVELSKQMKNHCTK